MVTHKELLLLLDRAIRDRVDKNGNITYDSVRAVIDGMGYEIEHKPKPVKKFIFVEDGSVDVDELAESLSESNPEIKVVVYRQGSRAPELVYINEVE